MRKLFLALVASLAFAVAACGPGGGTPTSSPTLDPLFTPNPGGTDGATMDPGMSPTDGMTMEPSSSP